VPALTDTIRRWAIKTWKNPLASLSVLHLFVVSFAISVPVGNRLALATVDQRVVTNGKSEGKTSFTLIRMARGVTKDGGSFSENIFQALDAQKVYEYIIHTGSTDKVKKDFDASAHRRPLRDNCMRERERSEPQILQSLGQYS
jgi:hypothetical protein